VPTATAALAMVNTVTARTGAFVVTYWSGLLAATFVVCATLRRLHALAGLQLIAIVAVVSALVVIPLVLKTPSFAVAAASRST
jgi:hypothetical protein